VKIDMNLLDFMSNVDIVVNDDDVTSFSDDEHYDDEEIWKPLVRLGRAIPGYMISTHGRILGKKNQILKPSYNATGGYAKHQLYVRRGFFGDEYEYALHHASKNLMTVTIRVHKAVMETHNPIKDNPPFRDILPEDYENCSDVVKEWIDNANQWIAATAFIDHIDDDVRNNHVSNLRWVTPKQNQIHHKAHELGVPILPKNPNNNITSARMLMKEGKKV
jgi:hypothetical protein